MLLDAWQRNVALDVARCRATRVTTIVGWKRSRRFQGKPNFHQWRAAQRSDTTGTTNLRFAFNWNIMGERAKIRARIELLIRESTKLLQIYSFIRRLFSVSFSRFQFNHIPKRITIASFLAHILTAERSFSFWQQLVVLSMETKVFSLPLYLKTFRFRIFHVRSITARATSLKIHFYTLYG